MKDKAKVVAAVIDQGFECSIRIGFACECTVKVFPEDHSAMTMTQHAIKMGNSVQIGHL
jgi:hypothetical protein